MSSSAIIDDPNASRRRWMAVLARAPVERLRTLLDDCSGLPDYAVMRGPEQGLVILRGRAGGGGAAFNVGEMTVTRCTVRTASGFVGHAYIPGREGRHAELAALADALLQDARWTDELEHRVITPLDQQQAQRRTERANKAAATQVQFFAMQTMRT